MIATSTDKALVEFVAGLSLGDVPGPTRARLGLLLADMAAVSTAGRPAPASAMAAGYAATAHPGAEATLLVDGRRVGAVGAAFANGVLANVLDFDDGHRLTKGHPGAVIIPATLAVAQRVNASVAQWLEAVVVGYEVAIRAGIALHDRDASYHASGAWGGVGAAVAAARLLALDGSATLAAAGLAEYHAPIAHIMRSCAEPQMTKDACAWGAAVGVSSALLAAQGFTSVRPEFLDSELDDLGGRWRLEELYVKAYPCCRWSQGAIAAVMEATGGRTLTPGDVRRVQVRTFAAADGLAKVVPETTEEAQYSLLWPVACALTRGRFGVPEVLGPFGDVDIRAMFERVEIEVDPVLTAQFPHRRLTAVEIELIDGERLAAGPLEAAGEPDDPRLPAVVRSKVSELIGPSQLGEPAGRAPISRHDIGVRLAELGPEQLLGIMCHAGTVLGDA
ncbi:MAG TPA: MmgE/PrpD family protein [Solirubrobacteraceae bacterium]|jgi:2-methylcitrate dehydratase PrpD|nr:MmgE/PrpD family protein [Solirubrobacteraceae bacterium]